MTYNQLTTEQFVERAKAIHGDKYDYSETVYQSFYKPVLIRCSKHGVFEQIAGNHVNPKIKAGCPYCAHRKVFYGETDLESQCPEVALHFDGVRNGITARDVFVYSNKKYWWKCDNGLDHCYKMSANAKVSRHQGCPICSGQQLCKGFNDLATVYPELVNEWDFDKNIGSPSDYRYGSGYKAWWICSECGRSYQSPINIHIRGHKCPYCNGSCCVPGVNDLETVSPLLAMEWSDENALKASEVSAFSHKKYKWKCPVCGGTYECDPHHRQAGSRCSLCHMSLGEYKVAKVLNKFDLIYKQQGYFSDCRDVRPLRFDFILYDKSGNWIGAIEYNGPQHYKPVDAFGGRESYEKQVKRDLIKISYCLNKGVPILNVTYQQCGMTVEEEVENFLRNLGIKERMKYDED